MNNKILVTRSSMPDFEEYIEEIKRHLGFTLAYQYGTKAQETSSTTQGLSWC